MIAILIRKINTITEVSCLPHVHFVNHSSHTQK